MKITYSAVFKKMPEIIHAIDHNTPFDVIIPGWKAKVANKIICLYNKKQSEECLTNYESLKLFILYALAIRLWGVLHYAQEKSIQITIYEESNILTIKFKPRGRAL